MSLDWRWGACYLLMVAAVYVGWKLTGALFQSRWTRRTIERWRDMSGHGRDLVQPDPSKRPRRLW